MKEESHGFTRREALRVFAGGLVLAALPIPSSIPLDHAKARPMTQEHLIPEDKHLDPAWIESLTARGTPEIYRGDELRFIGMPIGGIACGQLYLGGDGRLWHWDVFKSNLSRMSYDPSFDAMEQCGHYIHPVAQGEEYTPHNGARVEQGFRLTLDGERRTLDRNGFPGVTFRGEYPIGRVAYRDEAAPVEVHLEAFSPFIPLEADDSGLPATVMAFTLRNVSDRRVTAMLEGWLQNAVCPAEPASPSRQNTLVLRNGLATVAMTADAVWHARPGFGSMALSLRTADGVLLGSADARLDEDLPAFRDDAHASGGTDRPHLGGLGLRFDLGAGETRTVEFLISWFFPSYAPAPDQAGAKSEMGPIEGFPDLQRHYAARFVSATDVAHYVHTGFDRLATTTRLWNRTWYDSTLPHWLLDRTFIPTDCLATQTSHRFDNGRFWGWEGVDSCPGTCQHVWNYAQALARLFPEIERDLREGVDFGLALHADGGTSHRGECDPKTFTDGHAGTIVRAWREHTISPDGEFLRRIWPGVRRAIEFLIAQDDDRDGILEGEQENTLDAAWYGPMAWISSVYGAALRCGGEMATEIGDAAFAATCREIADRGRETLVTRLYDGEYFIHRPPDFAHINSNRGCHIDQVLGQSWAWQVGVDRVVPQDETVSALRALWKYNFAPDAGGYAIAHTAIKGHRIYAERGEAGLVMTTWPKGGAEDAVPGMADVVETFDRYLGPGGYFDECMTGFEYQAAAHMIYEGEAGGDLVRNGLAITRAVHDRYAPGKRNPYNEIECSDHYARAMAAYGVFLAVCGFRYHGPKGEIAFVPRISPENFRASFTAAQGWGTFAQSRSEDSLSATLTVRHGRLRVHSIGLEPDARHRATSVEVRQGERRIAAHLERRGRSAVVMLSTPVVLRVSEAIHVTIS